jgi:two-component system OmpR family response regulator
MTTVLVVDDCGDFRDVVGDILVDAGYKVLLADGPDQAHVLLGHTKPNIVICDLVMPLEGSQPEDGSSAMVGVHMLHEITKALPGVPVIAVSGELTGAPLQAMQNFGAMTTLSKPFGQSELLQAVERALQQSATVVV